MSKEVGLKNRDRFLQFGISVSTLRKIKGMSQEQLAEKACMSRSHLPRGHLSKKKKCPQSMQAL